MLPRLFLLFVLLPMADLILLLLLAKIHWLITVTLIVFSGIFGAWLVRRQGVAVVSSLRSDVSDGKIPTSSLMDGGMVLLAAGLLLTPGLLTDLIGVSFLIPQCRVWYRKRVQKWLKGKVEVHAKTFTQPASESTIDGEFKRTDSSDH